MRKAVLLSIFLLSLAGNSAAQLESDISDECAEDFEPIASMADPNVTFNNIGTPERYEYQVCVRGIIDATFQNDCPGTTSFYMSSNSTYAHFSETQGYNLGVCTESMRTQLRDSCDNGETPLFTVSNPINGFGRHIAGLANDKSYGNVVCAFDQPPQNVTLELKFNHSSNDDVYFDDQRVEGEFSDEGIAEFPYILGTDEDLVSGIIVNRYKKITRKIDSENVYRVRKDKDNPTFYVPYTTGGYESVEDDQERFFEGGIENTINPSFAMDMGGTPTVRAIAEQEAIIVSNLSIGAGGHSIRIEKIGENEIIIKER